MIIALLDHKKLIKAMEAKNATQEELAEEINITDRHLRNLRERDTDISVSLCYRLSQVFQIPMEELLVVREEEMEE
ncbi:helix-turn-helix transcriptional regulator [Oscillospiraceae bacterium 50-16]|nr:helix-turn-helix transcriptional regulator [Lawsonibacter sp.]